MTRPIDSFEKFVRDFSGHAFIGANPREAWLKLSACAPLDISDAILKRKLVELGARIKQTPSADGWQITVPKVRNPKGKKP